MSEMLDEWAKKWRPSRMFVDLKEGEEAPRSGPFVRQPPEGMRWETDEEFRVRLQARGPDE